MAEYKAVDIIKELHRYVNLLWLNWEVRLAAEFYYLPIATTNGYVQEGRVFCIQDSKQETWKTKNRFYVCAGKNACT